MQKYVIVYLDAVYNKIKGVIYYAPDFNDAIDTFNREKSGNRIIFMGCIDYQATSPAIRKCWKMDN